MTFRWLRSAFTAHASARRMGARLLALLALALLLAAGRPGDLPGVHAMGEVCAPMADDGGQPPAHAHGRGHCALCPTRCEDDASPSASLPDPALAPSASRIAAVAESTPPRDAALRAARRTGSFSSRAPPRA